jgi:hypothetical protein
MGPSSRILDRQILLAALAGLPLLAAAQAMRCERIAYPRAVTTLITGISDQGTIIGTYTLGELPAAPKGNKRDGAKNPPRQSPARRCAMRPLKAPLKKWNAQIRQLVSQPADNARGIAGIAMKLDHLMRGHARIL